MRSHETHPPALPRRRRALAVRQRGDRDRPALAGHQPHRRPVRRGRGRGRGRHRVGARDALRRPADRPVRPPQRRGRAPTSAAPSSVAAIAVVDATFGLSLVVVRRPRRRGRDLRRPRHDRPTGAARRRVDDLGRARSTRSPAASRPCSAVAFLAGPGVAGFLMTVLEPIDVVWLTAACSAAAALATLCMRAHRRGPRGPRGRGAPRRLGDDPAQPRAQVDAGARVRLVVRDAAADQRAAPQPLQRDRPSRAAGPVPLGVRGRVAGRVRALPGDGQGGRAVPPSSPASSR